MKNMTGKGPVTGPSGATTLRVRQSSLSFCGLPGKMIA
ncbi:Uncharacterised protein [Mycobacteroides abscessus subsp. bolletii]|nr:Uncharacterised protein [Mycobacteroides abscessus subsp. bolletii]SKW19201.1 Uncharacterised protein [Mycobacteroides abscessus subsp. abscessus]